MSHGVFIFPLDIYWKCGCGLAHKTPLIYIDKNRFSSCSLEVCRGRAFVWFAVLPFLHTLTSMIV